MRHARILCSILGLLACGIASARAGVVINEIFYHAPADMDQVQWIELFNSGDQPVDVSDWKLDQGRLFIFPKGTAIAPGGYLIIALSPDQMRQIYRVPSIGPFKRPLKRGSETIELSNAAGERVDIAKYKDQEPWPASADGYAASLERISPSVSGEMPENWKGSPLPEIPRPAGTPGKPNAAFAASLPPAIKIVSPIAEDLSPKDAIKVELEAKDPAAITEIALLHRVVADAVLGAETSQPMEKDPATGRFSATIPPQTAGTLLRYRIQVTGKDGASRFYPHDTDLRPTFSTYIHEPFPSSKIPLAFILRGQPPRGLRGLLNSRQPQPLPNNNIRPPRGTSAFVHVNSRTGQTTVFDHININDRRKGGGYKVHFHKDNTLNGMTAISVVFEGSERHLMAEALAYDVYRRAGNAASLTDFLRVTVDGRQAGHFLMIENPNRSFLRRNKIDDSGNLYKIRWYGRGVIGQHEKKTNTDEGHDDLVALIDLLAKTRDPDEQWRLIQENFNVQQVATYFAVNMVLSHWDGYFNNYYTYHDTKNNKWEIYPWDQDKTWGFHDGIDANKVFVTMPLTFGMLGDPRPQGGDGQGLNPFGPGPAWWRPGGYFSTPLLANPQFRQIFLARVREILEKHYTEEVYFPFIDQTAERLKEDVALRSRFRGGDADYAAQVMEHNVKLLKTHLQKRRAFLLEQDELKKLR